MKRAIPLALLAVAVGALCLSQTVAPNTPAPAEKRFDPKYLTTMLLFNDRAAYDKHRAANPALGLPEQAPFNYDVNQKLWIDVDACRSSLKRITYQRAFVLNEKGVILDDARGKPLVDVMQLTKIEACSTNIPPSAAFPDGKEGAFAIPYPMRALAANEEFEYGIGKVLYVRRLDLWPHSADVVEFTATDREMLKQILALLQKLTAAPASSDK